MLGLFGYKFIVDSENIGMSAVNNQIKFPSWVNQKSDNSSKANPLESYSPQGKISGKKNIHSNQLLSYDSQQNVRQQLNSDQNPEEEQLKILVKKFIKERKSSIDSMKVKAHQAENSLEKRDKKRMKRNSQFDSAGETLDASSRQKVQKDIRNRLSHLSNLNSRQKRGERQSKLAEQKSSLQKNTSLEGMIKAKHLQDYSKYSDCTCKQHCSPIKYQLRDPPSKFLSHYNQISKEVKKRSSSNLKKHQQSASYFSSQLGQLPQYSPKSHDLSSGSSYKKSYFASKGSLQDKVQNQKHLKNSSVTLGPKQIKNYNSSYMKDYKEDQKDGHSQKLKNTPMPFVVQTPENLNTLGLKYHSIDSVAHKNHDSKKNINYLPRSSLKPHDLFKDVNLYLVKDSKYQEAFNQDISKDAHLKRRSSKKKAPKEQKFPVVHHLSSSFIQVDPSSPRSIKGPTLESSYKDGFKPNMTMQNMYSCSYGHKSSNGKISKMH